MKAKLMIQATLVGILLLADCGAQNQGCLLNSGAVAPKAYSFGQQLSPGQSFAVAGSCSDHLSPCSEVRPCVGDAFWRPPTAGDSGSSSATGQQTGVQMSIKRVFANLPGDQKDIWLSPFHLRLNDASWALPFAGVSGLLFAHDRRIMLRERSSPDAITLSDDISNGGTLALAGVPAAMYLLGNLNGSRRSTETGLLTGEGMINSFVVAEALKRAFGRERPTTTDGQGRFFRDFGDPSFPSTHSMLSWTAASIIAHEYPGWLSQTLAYGTASAVSIARVTGRKHFPSDVVIGGGLGWLIGHQMYVRHHYDELDDAQFGSFIPEGHRFEGPQTGTTYVPIDSWVYPEFDRLAALGYTDTAQVGIRPWTRSECARLLEEAGQAIGLDDSSPSWAAYERLRTEFAPELENKPTQPSLWLENLYSRLIFVSGTPLADDYHFAKTFTYDFGRPFGQGANSITGASTRATVGSLSFYIRGEYQHAGTLPSLGVPAQQAIVNLEGLPFAPPQRTDALDRFRLLDAYAGVTFHDNLISFGTQTLWWGPGADGPFLASNNAEPIPMLRISRVKPFALPWILRVLGGIRAEAFWGELGGQQFVALLDSAGTSRRVIAAPLRPHPFIQGAKFSFKPTRNFEFGFSETAILSGPEFPLTLHSILRSYSPGGNTLPGQPGDPGDRRSAFDFSYRIPGLRNWLSFYADSFTEDELSPITFPRKSAMRGGLYLPQLPKLKQVDLRLEGVYTDIPSLEAVGVSYFNGHYLSGYTNYGQIIGNAIGREGRGVNVWTTYRFNASDNLQFHYRNQRVNPEFLQGGYLQDFDVVGTLARTGGLVFWGGAKYEHWNFPLLSSAPKNNISVSLQMSFQPLHGFRLFEK